MALSVQLYKTRGRFYTLSSRSNLLITLPRPSGSVDTEHAVKKAVLSCKYYNGSKWKVRHFF